MKPPIPRWLWFALIAVLVLGIATGIFFAFRASVTAGLITVAILVVLLGILAAIIVPPLLKMYRFQKYFQQHEKQFNTLPSLMQAGRTQEALARFENMMKEAPDSAYMFYVKAMFLQAAGKLPEAVSAANKALALAPRDQFLPIMLQQNGGQMGQPTTLDGFKTQLEELKRSLEPRVNQMRERREKAVKDRKKKSR